MSKEAIGLAEALAIHTEPIQASGGSDGVRDQGGLEAALERPFMTFDQTELYPEPVDKAAAILESTVMNHPFVDGNKRWLLLDAFDPEHPQLGSGGQF